MIRATLVSLILAACGGSGLIDRRPDADGDRAMTQDWQINGERKWQLSIYLA